MTSVTQAQPNNSNLHGSDQPENYTFGDKVSHFLYFCAGCDVDILKQCSHTDTVKYQGIGGVVLATATLAFFSGSYAFYTVFVPKVGFALSVAQQESYLPAYIGAVFFGIVWSLMIFNLDRFIVSSSGQGDGTDAITLGEVGRALPRIIMAIMIGLVLSKPLEIRIMQSEIDARLQIEQDNHAHERQKLLDQEYSLARKDLDAKKAEKVALRDNDEKELNSRQKIVDAARLALQNEIDGGPGSSGRPGCAKSCQQKKENLDKDEAELQEERKKNEPAVAEYKEDIKRIQTDIDNLNKKREDELLINKKGAAQLDGLIERISIAEEIAPIASRLLTALLIILEIAPIFFKMMLTISPYDYLTENRKRLIVARNGIDISKNLSTDKNTMIDVKNAIFYQAEVVEAQDIGKLKIEKELTALAQEKFTERLKEDIPRNLDNYIAPLNANEIKSS